MLSLDALFAEAASRGLRLINLFQLHDGSFRANFADDRGGHPFGEHKSAQEAVRLALAAVPDRTQSMGSLFD
jgi:hypothetical protein